MADAAHHLHRAVHAGRHDRRHRPHHRAAARADARPAGGRRQQAGRGGRGRRGRRREGEARRLHAARRHDQHARDQREPLLRTCRTTRSRTSSRSRWSASSRTRCTSIRTCGVNTVQELIALAQEGSDRAHVRVVRRRHLDASRRRALRRPDRRQAHARARTRARRRRSRTSSGGQRRVHVRPADRRRAARQGRQAASCSR